jgi:hypothetical protein
MFIAASAINLLVFATLAQSQLLWNPENILFMHYFLFNAVLASAAVVLYPYCSLNGYGQIVASVGSIMALTMVTLRCTSFSKHPLWIWVTPIWVIIGLISTASFTDNINVFILLESGCVKDFAYTSTIWTVLVSFEIFFSLLTFLLSSSFMISAYFSTELRRGTSTFLRLFSVISLDATLSVSHAVTSIIFDINGELLPAHSSSLVLNCITLTRIISTPIVFLVLHRGFRTTFFKLVTLRWTVMKQVEGTATLKKTLSHNSNHSGFDSQNEIRLGMDLGRSTSVENMNRSRSDSAQPLISNSSLAKVLSSMNPRPSRSMEF